MRKTGLTEPDPRCRREARGALWVEVATPSGTLHVVNTHLGLTTSERQTQVSVLLEEQWIGGIDADDPIVVCGDLNAGPRSRTVGRLHRFLESTESRCTTHDRTQTTFPSGFPLRRVDHVLFNDRVTCAGLSRLQTLNSNVASDHLPMVADLILQPASDIDSSSCRREKGVGSLFPPEPVGGDAWMERNIRQ